MTYGWDVVKTFEADGKDGLNLRKRWPTVNLKLSTDGEKTRFGTTGLEQAQRAYLSRHYDGSTMRMFVYMRIVHAGGERNILGWRAELNPKMPEEYLNPDFPEDKKEGEDWDLMIHWVGPADIRGTGILIRSYNNKAKDNDTWVWFPSLRKARRLTPSNGDDMVAGADLTFAEGFLLRLTDETHQIIGETSFRGFLPVDYYEGLYIMDKYGPGTKEYVEFYKNKVAQRRDCWVVKAKSKRGGYGAWYNTRIVFIDKEWGCEYGWEIYDRKGRMMKCTEWWHRRSTDYNGNPRMAWVNLLEIINFEDSGYNYIFAPETNFGSPVPSSWFTLRELKKSIPTVMIPYMAVLPPKELAPLEELYTPAARELRKSFLPERITSFPERALPVAIEQFP